jgi:hypothetical protein
MSDFLVGLKKAADTGEFNSETAKKIVEINQINELVDKAMKGEIQNPSIFDIIEKAGKKTVTPEEAELANAEYEIKMKKIESVNKILKITATLNNIENAVLESAKDMFKFIEDVEKEVLNSCDDIKIDEYPMTDLSILIETIKNKYSPIFDTIEEKQKQYTEDLLEARKITKTNNKIIN